MGNGLHRRKQTVREMEEERTKLASSLQALHQIFSFRFKQFEEEMNTLRHQLETVDTRSVALVRLSLDKNLLAMSDLKQKMEDIHIENFNKGVEIEDKNMGLTLAPETGIGAGTTFVLSFKAFKQDGTEVVSSIRSQVQFGQGQLPAEVEKELEGLLANSDKEFEIDAPESFGPAHKGTKLKFAVHVFAVKVAAKPAEVVG
jgi:hypothetical protein